VDIALSSHLVPAQLSHRTSWPYISRPGLLSLRPISHWVSALLPCRTASP